MFDLIAGREHHLPSHSTVPIVPNPLLDRAAEAALREWRYSPIVLNGTPVPFTLTVTLSFFLEGSE
jgi:hypothetical protein